MYSHSGSGYDQERVRGRGFVVNNKDQRRKRTTQRSHRLVSLAVRKETLAGETSGGACRV